MQMSLVINIPVDALHYDENLFPSSAGSRLAVDYSISQELLKALYVFK